MAVDLWGTYCVQFGEASDHWLSSPGTFEYTNNLPCNRPWVVVPSDKYAELVALNNAEPVAASSPFNLSVEDGSVIGFLILLAWAIAWGFKVLARSVRDVGDAD